MMLSFLRYLSSTKCVIFILVFLGTCIYFVVNNRGTHGYLSYILALDLSKPVETESKISLLQVGKQNASKKLNEVNLTNTPIDKFRPAANKDSMKQQKKLSTKQETETLTKGRNGRRMDRFSPPGESNGMAPCGEICSYSGQIIQDEGLTYPKLRKMFSCDAIMKRMAFRDHVIEYPPPKNPPLELIDAFTMNGDMPILKMDYRNSQAGPNRTMSFTKSFMDEKVAEVLRGDPVNTYADGNCVQDTLKKYADDIKGHRTLVIGTLRPWLEAILLAYGANSVTTLEYTNIECELSNMEAYFPYTFAEKYIKGETTEFDFAASFSSIEHSGLGRYTDPLNPFGDFEAMAQVWCMTKPGGLFAVGVPGNRDGRNGIVWNAHRVYGNTRLQHLTANWDVVEQMQCKNGHHLLVIRKPIH